MADRRSAGSLYYKVALLKREDVDDGMGNTVGQEWVEQFQTRAEFIHLRGGEAVIAGRLQGKHTQVIRVRNSSNTRLISTDWMLRDVRTGKSFNIRDIEHEVNRQFIALTCESGVATG
ncbi:phage head-tail adaptor [Brucella inopinata BO1]|uniref:head closure protein n=1 Tax=Brucella phage BiPBO1 TaxID=1718278 RepID=UPI0001E1611F|nr:phage head closure protein [Brucella inopinata]YP_009304037.1 head closure protein [Brucella phage BiPBO1]ALJ98223.1 head-tail-adapter [Brucella phage BiPBO1]EFM55117.1 phage head-tail adaptor [Brucella inopinata BO1]KEY04146.1 phage head-tail adapter protein [Brucella suis bv. 4 str. 40]